MEYEDDRLLVIRDVDTEASDVTESPLFLDKLFPKSLWEAESGATTEEAGEDELAVGVSVSLDLGESEFEESFLICLTSLLMGTGTSFLDAPAGNDIEADLSPPMEGVFLAAGGILPAAEVEREVAWRDRPFS